MSELVLSDGSSFIFHAKCAPPMCRPASITRLPVDSPQLDQKAVARWETRLSSGIYIGFRQHLIGKRAVFSFPPEAGFVLAQFDDKLLTLSGDAPRSADDSLGFGWHLFRSNEFEKEA